MRRRDVLVVVVAGTVTGCTGDGPDGDRSTPAHRQGPTITSPAFENDQPIPRRYTCDGEGGSPPLTVSEPGTGAETWALIVDDPDAPRPEPYVHWLLWNLPAEIEEIPPNVPTGERVETLGDAPQGTNSAGSLGYTPPCPPRGDDPHRYRFTVYGVAGRLGVDPGADRAALERALDDHDPARAVLTGTYGR